MSDLHNGREADIILVDTGHSKAIFYKIEPVINAVVNDIKT